MLQSLAAAVLRYGVLVCAALVAFPSMSPAADELTLGVGGEYSSGNFGATEKTEIFYFPITGKFEAEPWTFKVVVPYVRVTGPGNVVGAGGDRVVLPGIGPGRRTESGLGDIVASAFYSLLSEQRAAVGVDIGAKVKLGTADEQRGLGTGQDDLAIQADLFKPMGELGMFGTLGYRFFGDPPGVDLRDVFYGSLGVSYRVDAQTTVGAAYDFRPRIIAGGGEVSEVTAFISQRVSRSVKLQAYAIAGFGKASPDFGIGAVLNHSF